MKLRNSLKMRKIKIMNKEGQIKDSGKWLTTILSTGEASLLSKANQNIGLKVRLTELSNVNWTKNADHANRIKAGVLENYGHAAPRIATKLGVLMATAEITEEALELGLNIDAIL